MHRARVSRGGQKRHAHLFLNILCLIFVGHLDIFATGHKLNFVLTPHGSGREPLAAHNAGLSQAMHDVPSHARQQLGEIRYDRLGGTGLCGSAGRQLGHVRMGCGLVDIAGRSCEPSRSKVIENVSKKMSVMSVSLMLHKLVYSVGDIIWKSCKGRGWVMCMRHNALWGQCCTWHDALWACACGMMHYGLRHRELRLEETRSQAVWHEEFTPTSRVMDCLSKFW